MKRPLQLIKSALKSIILSPGFTLKPAGKTAHRRQFRQGALSSAMSGTTMWCAMLATTLLLTGCSQTHSTNAAVATTEAVIPASTRQLVVVVSDNWDASTGQLYQFSRATGQSWQATGQRSTVDLGRNGTAWGLGLHPVQSGPQKQEGDGKAPAGLFRLSAAFGALPALKTQMPYQQMSRFDYCIDVPTSPLYNQTLDIRRYRPEWTAGSSEPMRRDLIARPDNVYLQGLFIDHNFSSGEARQTAAGSCIFMHLKSPDGRKTAGCTALAPEHLSALLQWLTPQAEPLYLLLPAAEYQRLQQDWQLPLLPSQH